MKARLRYKKCQKCGYEYNPKVPSKPVVAFSDDAGDYIACLDCLNKLKDITENGTEHQKKLFMAKLRIKNGDTK